jgi:excisionase family DNA binding protein
MAPRIDVEGLRPYIHGRKWRLVFAASRLSWQRMIEVAGAEGLLGGRMAQGNSGPEPLLLTVEQAAKLLAVGKGTAYEMVRQGQIPHVRLGPAGRIIRVPRWGLEQWVAREAGLPQPPPQVVSFGPQRH